MVIAMEERLKGATIVLAFAVLTGCAAQRSEPFRAPSVPQTPVVYIPDPFDPEQAQRLIGDGVNQIRGSAFLRQQGGGVVTCAGNAVQLIPATPYAKKRIDALYEPKGDTGYNSSRLFNFNPDPPEYKTFTRGTKCDAQGNFVFDRVADGEFFVQTTVIWSVGYKPQGGGLVQRVSVAGGQIANLIISR